jgi:hypothetical protein
MYLVAKIHFSGLISKLYAYFFGGTIFSPIKLDEINKSITFPHDTIAPNPPTLSQITKPVATTPTIIRQFSWKAPKIPLPLHQFHTFS